MNFNFLTSALEHTTIPDSLLIALVGMTIVFLVLAILIIILICFEYIFKIKWLRDDYEKPSKKASASLAQDFEAENNDDDIVAISAALMCYFDTEIKETTNSAPFKIRNIKRIK